MSRRKQPLAVRSPRFDDRDVIVFDVERRELRVELSDEEIRKRLASWKQPEARYRTGVMAKYARQVSSAALGAVTN